MRFRSNPARRGFWGRFYQGVFLAATLVGILALVVLLVDVALDSWGWLTPERLLSFPSRFPEKAGYLSGLVGSVSMIGLTALFAFPLGVGAAIYLEEYAAQNRLTRIIEININNLAGVPSIIYGILGLAFFVRGLALGRSLLAGALTMTLLILPIIIIASREAIRAVPSSIREAAFALGATRWQVVLHQVLPAAFPGILTGTILALSRAMGESAPLIMIGALTYVAFLPKDLFDQFTVLPIQIFNYISLPQPEFHHVAAAGIFILLTTLLTMNGLAIYLRNRYQVRW